MVLAKFIATCAYVGNIKHAPGTFGSLLALPIHYIIIHILFANQAIFGVSAIKTLLIAELIVVLVLLGVGWWATHLYVQQVNTADPKEVVVDELVGQLLTCCLTTPAILLLHKFGTITAYDYHLLIYGLPFILFRFFDIVKPWPINWVDQKISGAAGVMLDDILAAIFAITAELTIVILLSSYL